ncbi:MAG: glycosyltransferase [Candidatus Methanomethylicaceae archaeon]
MKIDEYIPIVGEEAVEEVKRLGEDLKDRELLHINSTYVGGGVAELLKSLVPLMNDVGLKTEWKTILGDKEFFDITKSFHNALHGADIEITQGMMDKYLEVNLSNAEHLELSKDFIFVHDPQPAALIQFRKGGKWVWRCHIDISSPNRGVWDFLAKFVSKYDAVVVHLPDYKRPDLQRPQCVIPPSIDPLSEKNIDLPASYVEKVLRKYDLDPEMPIITQVSRFDRLKDPLGVLKAFELAKKGISTFDFRSLLDENTFAFDLFRTLKYRVSLQLVLVGGSATDDPEGEKVHYEVFKKAVSDRNVHILMLPPDAHREINAIQRGSTILIQKSIKEGFGLTVTEGMWKGKPVIGGKTGGIKYQIIDGETGFLVSKISEAAERILYLIKNPKVRRSMGIKAKEHVRKNFLVTRHLRDYLKLMKEVQVK